MLRYILKVPVRHNLPSAFLYLGINYRVICCGFIVCQVINSETEIWKCVYEIGSGILLIVKKMLCVCFFQTEGFTLTGGENPKTHNRMFIYVTNSLPASTHLTHKRLRFSLGYRFSSFTLHSHACTVIVTLIRTHTLTHTHTHTHTHTQRNILSHAMKLQINANFVYA